MVLHDVQANRKGALTLEEPTPIDPRITILTPLSLISQASLVPPKTSYNRSQKRNIAEIADNKNETTNSSNKKVDLRVVITALSKEIACNQYTKEAYKSNQEKAIKLLEKEYKV